VDLKTWVTPKTCLLANNGETIPQPPEQGYRTTREGGGEKGERKKERKGKEKREKGGDETCKKRNQQESTERNVTQGNTKRDRRRPYGRIMI
jgi:hypothetical protein